jgi:mercuric ion binding protein
MKISAIAFAAALSLFNGQVFAAEKTLKLTVDKMTCVACPTIVKGSLEAVPGVSKVEVSFENKTAIVTFDDAKANIDLLIEATTNAGYPSVAKL